MNDAKRNEDFWTRPTDVPEPGYRGIGADEPAVRVIDSSGRAEAIRAQRELMPDLDHSTPRLDDSPPRRAPEYGSGLTPEQRAGYERESALRGEGAHHQQQGSSSQAGLAALRGGQGIQSSPAPGQPGSRFSPTVRDPQATRGPDVPIHGPSRVPTGLRPEAKSFDPRTGDVPVYGQREAPRPTGDVPIYGQPQAEPGENRGPRFEEKTGDVPIYGAQPAGGAAAASIRERFADHEPGQGAQTMPSERSRPMILATDRPAAGVDIDPDAATSQYGSIAGAAAGIRGAQAAKRTAGPPSARRDYTPPTMDSPEASADDYEKD